MQGGAHTAFEEDGLFGVGADFLEEVEVLHVARADLDDVDIVEEFDIGEVHEFGDDGEACFAFGDLEHAEAFCAEALEGVGGGARFEGAAAEHGGAGGFDGLGDADDLLFAFDATRACDDAECAVADFDA